MDIEKAKKGTLRVSQNVIITITKNAALEVKGVSRVAVRSLDIMRLYSSKLDNSLINIEMLDGVAKISLSIVVLSGYNVMSVCEQIQEKVKSAVQSMTGVTVSKVNVSVVDVDFPVGSAEENS